MIGHTGYFGCTYCCQEGRRVGNTLAFDSKSGELRTHEMFSNYEYQEHQTSPSPFVGSPFVDDMIWNFPIDSMHCLDLGITKKILELLIKGKHIDTKVTDSIITLMKKFVPREFARRPRQLNKIKKFKASEFRQFALYLLLVILRLCGLVDVYYEHFMKFFVAYRLILGENGVVSPANLAKAQELFEKFVADFENLYGANNITPNVHAALHLCKIVEKFGPINEYSAYKFENYYQLLRKWIRKPEDLEKQVYNRWYQNKGLIKTRQESNKFGSTVLNKKPKDSCIMLNDGSIFVITDKKRTQHGFAYKGKKYLACENFFEAPVSSSSLGIFEVSQLSEEKETIDLQNFRKKMVRLPYGSNFVVLPMIHC